MIDTFQQVRVKSTTGFANQPSGFQALFQWAAKHRPQHLPLSYVMESTGVYHEQLDWYLYQQHQALSILLANKAKQYLMRLGHTSKNEQMDALGLARMGLEQHLPLWQPLSKNIYPLPRLTGQHQRLQELKSQWLNQQHALAASQFTDLFIIKQNDQRLELYDQQLAHIKDAIEALLQQDEPLKRKVARLTAIKGLGLRWVSNASG